MDTAWKLAAKGVEKVRSIEARELSATSFVMRDGNCDAGGDSGGGDSGGGGDYSHRGIFSVGRVGHAKRVGKILIPTRRVKCFLFG